MGYILSDNLASEGLTVLVVIRAYRLLVIVEASKESFDCSIIIIVWLLLFWIVWAGKRILHTVLNV